MPSEGLEKFYEENNIPQENRVVEQTPEQVGDGPPVEEYITIVTEPSA